MKRVIGIGNALVDVITRIDDDILLSELGLPKGSMQLVDMEKSAAIKARTKCFGPAYSAGGSAANTVHGLGMLGLNPGYIGKVGKDPDGDYFDGDMRRGGVENILYRSATPTGTSTVLVSPDSERTMATHLGAAVEINADEIYDGIFDGYDILYLEGYLVPDNELIKRLCGLAKEKGMEIAIDMASYNIVEENLAFFREIADKYVDILFANEDEARAFTGEEADRAVDMIAGVCSIAVVKTGSRGSLIRRGEERLMIGAMAGECVDTTGAGDLYAAGFLYGYANGLNLEKCGLLGTLLAGNVICAVGAKMDENRWATIRRNVVEIERME
ncbi:MAG: adenosine kinase [Bacteroidales bacterium]|jgi:sugar/nucleoside kinase (ribokinase family)